MTATLVTPAHLAQWTVVAHLEDIPVLGARVVKLDGLQIAVFRTRDNQVFALKDSCPHRQGPLSQGIVHGTSVTCPLHNWRIDLTTGRAIAPDEGCVRRFETKIDAQNQVYLRAGFSA